MATGSNDSWLGVLGVAAVLGVGAASNSAKKLALTEQHLANALGRLNAERTARICAEQHDAAVTASFAQLSAAAEDMRAKLQVVRVELTNVTVQRDAAEGRWLETDARARTSEERANEAEARTALAEARATAAERELANLRARLLELEARRDG